MVLCTQCGQHDVCPMELMGEQITYCDVCNQFSIHACGKCDVCLGIDGIDSNDEDAEFFEDYEQFTY